MRAAALKGGQIDILDLPDPLPTNGKLLVAPSFGGICGSDLHLQAALREAAEGLPEDERDAMPVFVPGHEFSARIVEFGPETETGLKRGDRVVPIPFTPMGHDYQVIGLSPVYSGGLATLSCVDAVRCLKIPESIDDALAALTEPMAVGLHAANLANRRKAPNIVVGCGPVGLAVIIALKIQDRGPILAADFSSERRAMAETLGADIVIDPAADSAFEHWSDLGFSEAPVSPLLSPDQTGVALGPNIFECVGAPGLLDNIIRNAPRHTHLIVVGVCPHEDKYTPQDAILKELAIDYSFAYTPEEFSASLRMIGDHQDMVSRLITSRLRLNQTAEAFEQLASAPTAVKILIEPGA